MSAATGARIAADEAVLIVERVSGGEEESAVGDAEGEEGEAELATTVLEEEGEDEEEEEDDDTGAAEAATAAATTPLLL